MSHQKKTTDRELPGRQIDANRGFVIHAKLLCVPNYSDHCAPGTFIFQLYSLAKGFLIWPEALRQRQAQGKNIVHIESGICILYELIAANQQAGANKEHQ